MKNLYALLTICVLAVTSSASPLVFKITKEIKDIAPTDFAEIAVFDATKFKEVRIGVVVLNGTKISNTNRLYVYALEGEDEIFLESSKAMSGRFDEIGGKPPSTSIFLENPPSKLRFVGQGSGTYKIFVWANQ